MQQVVDTEYIDMYKVSPQNFWVALEHMGRYSYAAWFVKKRKLNRVLDAACSNGYGTEMLADGVTTITGVDANAAHIDFANNKADKADNAQYLGLNLDQDDWTKALDQTKYDAIVCFETLEHISYPQKLMAAFKRLLSPTGRILLSVPAAQFEPVDENGKLKNAHHKHLFTDQDLKHLFSTNKLAVEHVLGQSRLNLLMRHHNAYCSRNPSVAADTTSNFALNKQAIAYYTKLFAYPEKNDTENAYSRIYILQHA